MRVYGASLDLNNVKAINVGDPTADTDGTNKQYVDALIRGLDWKIEAIAASTGNVTLATPGTTLDGVTLTNPMRILLKDQTAPEENGIYNWTGSGTALTRTLDADSATELSGATITIQQGTVNADRVYRCLADDPITVGTTALLWGQVGPGASTYTAGNGLVLTGSDFNVGAGTGITVAADSIAVDTSVVARKSAVLISATNPFVVAHGMGSGDIVPVVKEVSTNEFVYPDVKADATNITVTWGTAVSANAYRLIWTG